VPVGTGFLLAEDLRWSSWSFEPTALAGIALAAGLYVGALNHQRRTGAAIEWWRPAAFGAGLSILFLALSSPLDLAADDYLLLMHMAQHALLATVVPPLLILGLTPGMAQSFSRLPLVNLVLLAAFPLVAAFLFIANMWFWHIPAIYEAALDNLGIHVLMHVCFIGTGLLFWWPVIQDWPPVVRLPIAGKMVYLLVTGFPMGLLALLFFASTDVLYDSYESGPGLWGISPLTDQQVAGLIMGVVGETASFIAFTYLFLRLMEEP
jgi:putative membrane protein